MARIYDWGPVPFDDELSALLARFPGEVYVSHRQTKGGTLRAIRTCEDPDRRWTLIVSFTPRRKKGRPRFPTYEELTDARIELLPNNVRVVVELPEKLSADGSYGVRLREWRDSPPDAG